MHRKLENASFGTRVFFGAIAIWLVSGVMADTDTPGGDVANSISNAAATISRDGRVIWDDTVEIFAEANRKWDTIARNASLLYAPANQSAVYQMLTIPECVVRPVDEHIFVATYTYEFLCCHRRRLAPLRRIIHQANDMLTEGTTDSLSSTPEQMILNINDMMENDRLGFLVAACKDDVSIHTPEQSLVQGLGARLVGGDLLSSYLFLEVNLGSLLGCVQSPTLPPYCKSNAPLDIGDTDIAGFTFESNPLFAKCCNETALAEFDAYRLSATCV